jgi:CRP-like cAMP-binding protein
MNDPAQLARDLRHHYLFAALNEGQRAHLLAHVHLRAFNAAELLFSQGDPAHAFFVLQSGAVKLYRVSADGQEKVMRLISPGQSFAESVMFMDEPRYPVHCTGIESGALISIECRVFVELLKESFDTSRAVMAKMAQRIQAHWDEIEALTLQNSRYRVVHYLLTLIPAGGRGAVTVTLPARKIVIAAQLAVTPETLSRTLRTLSDEELIEVHEDVVHIPDVGRLQKHLH